jgi:hypothetical protein
MGTTSLLRSSTRASMAIVGRPIVATCETELRERVRGTLLSPITRKVCNQNASETRIASRASPGQLASIAAADLRQAVAPWAHRDRSQSAGFRRLRCSLDAVSADAWQATEGRLTLEDIAQYFAREEVIGIRINDTMSVGRDVWPMWHASVGVQEGVPSGTAAAFRGACTNIWLWSIGLHKPVGRSVRTQGRRRR